MTSTRISVELRGGRLVATVTGRYHADDVLTGFARLLEACRQHEVDRVLIDLRRLQGEGSATLQIIYRQRATALFRQHLAAGGGPLRIAYLGSPNYIRDWKPAPADPARAGLEVHATTDPAEAVGWLDAEA